MYISFRCVFTRIVVPYVKLKFFKIVNTYVGYWERYANQLLLFTCVTVFFFYLRRYIMVLLNFQCEARYPLIYSLLSVATTYLNERNTICTISINRRKVPNRWIPYLSRVKFIYKSRSVQLPFLPWHRSIIALNANRPVLRIKMLL